MGHASQLICLKSIYIWRQSLKLLQWINNRISFQVKAFFCWNVKFEVLLTFYNLFFRYQYLNESETEKHEFSKRLGHAQVNG